MTFSVVGRTLEPTIACPRCKHEFRIDESLAAPILEATRKEYEERLIKKDSDLAGRESAVRKQQDELQKARETINDEIEDRLNQERGKIIENAEKKARLSLETELEHRSN